MNPYQEYQNSLKTQIHEAEELFRAAHQARAEHVLFSLLDQRLEEVLEEVQHYPLKPEGCTGPTRFPCNKWDCPACGDLKSVEMFSKLSSVEIESGFLLIPPEDVSLPSDTSSDTLVREMYCRCREHLVENSSLPVKTCARVCWSQSDRPFVAVAFTSPAPDSSQIERTWVECGGLRVESLNIETTIVLLSSNTFFQPQHTLLKFHRVITSTGFYTTTRSRTADHTTDGSNVLESCYEPGREPF